jgi:hypothetical protein
LELALRESGLRVDTLLAADREHLQQLQQTLSKVNTSNTRPDATTDQQPQDSIDSQKSSSAAWTWALALVADLVSALHQARLEAKSTWSEASANLTTRLEDRASEARGEPATHDRVDAYQVQRPVVKEPGLATKFSSDAVTTSLQQSEYFEGDAVILRRRVQQLSQRLGDAVDRAADLEAMLHVEQARRRAFETDTLALHHHLRQQYSWPTMSDPSTHHSSDAHREHRHDSATSKMPDQRQPMRVSATSDPTSTHGLVRATSAGRSPSLERLQETAKIFSHAAVTGERQKHDQQGASETDNRTHWKISGSRTKDQWDLIRLTPRAEVQEERHAPLETSGASPSHVVNSALGEGVEKGARTINRNKSAIHAARATGTSISESIAQQALPSDATTCVSADDVALDGVRLESKLSYTIKDRRRLEMEGGRALQRPLASLQGGAEQNSRLVQGADHADANRDAVIRQKLHSAHKTRMAALGSLDAYLDEQLRRARSRSAQSQFFLLHSDVSWPLPAEESPSGS